MSEAITWDPGLIPGSTAEAGNPSVVQPVMDFSAKRTIGESVLYRLQTGGPQTMADLQRYFSSSPKSSVYAETWRLKSVGVLSKSEGRLFSISDLSKLPPGSFTGSAWHTRRRRMAQANAPQRKRRGPYKPRPEKAIKTAAEIEVGGPHMGQLQAPAKQAPESTSTLLTEVLHDAIALGVKIQRLHSATQTQGDTRFVANLLSQLGN